MSSFLPLISEENEGLFTALNRIGPVVLSAQSSIPLSGSPDHPYLLFEQTTDPADLGTLVDWLNEGIEKLILPLSWAKDVIGSIPPERLVLLIDVANVPAAADANPPPPSMQAEAGTPGVADKALATAEDEPEAGKWSCCFISAMC